MVLSSLQMENGSGNVLVVSNRLFLSGLQTTKPNFYSISTGPRSRGLIYTDQSTKNMNNHLAFSHGITKEYSDGPPTGQHLGEARESCIVAAFATVKPQFEFNSDTFKQFLTRWVFVTNTSFLTIEGPTFRALLTYLLACVR